ncbi:MAG: flagellar protein FlaG [Gammaproteobacteria bacterium]|nr:flagellar protein FlaG [Gammaproteobacteria bacterium]
MFPPPAQTTPTAPPGRVEQTADAKEKPTPAEQVQAADEEAESLENVVSDLNQLVRELHRELQFSVDEESGDTVVKVIDSETDEVLRQIPSDQVLRLRQRLEEAAGVIFQDSA